MVVALLWVAILRSVNRNEKLHAIAGNRKVDEGMEIIFRISSFVVHFEWWQMCFEILK